MQFDPLKYHRQSIRLKNYDYSQSGAYFVTICTQNRLCHFGCIENGIPELNDAGKIIQKIWIELPEYYPGVDIDIFVIMPNHIHGIIVLGGVGAGPRASPEDNTQPDSQMERAMTLPDVVHRFKSLTTTQYRHGVKMWNWPSFPGKLWQRNYYEHIIRSDSDLNRIRDYIQNNPKNWITDRLYPSA